MISGKKFAELVGKLPAVEQRRELDESELALVTGGYDDAYFPAPYMDVPFRMAREVDGGS